MTAAMRTELKILQVGFGGFGATHARAWANLGLAGNLAVADPLPEARAACRRLKLCGGRIAADYAELLDTADVVDVVAPTDRHFAICEAALAAGKDVFVEKPMTATLDEAEHLRDLAAAAGRIVQVGYYFRFHPLSRAVKQRLEAGALGRLRTVEARFVGYKRARSDSGAVHNDACHFIDLVNWLLGAFPVEVYAVLRDHFGRGMEDFAVLLLSYPGEILVRIEAGYILPGRWNDTIVPGATATKDLVIAGSEGAIEVDYVAQRMAQHAVRHDLIDGTWRPSFGDMVRPHIAAADPVEVVTAELKSFLDAVGTRAVPEAGAGDCGVRMARVIEAVFRSARENRPVACAGGLA